MPSQATTLSGVVKAIKFRNDDSGWSVFSVICKGDVKPINCVGIISPAVMPGVTVDCAGKWEDKGKFGKQFAVKLVKTAPVDVKSDKGVAVLLSQLPGLGMIKARKAVAMHGAELAWLYAKENPAKLKIPAAYRQKCKEKANILDGQAEALEYFFSIGMTPGQASKVLARYKSPDLATAIVKNNPYKLIDDIQGFGFLIVDSIALGGGLGIADNTRVKAAVVFVLNDGEQNQGNIWCYGGELIRRCTELLKKNVLKLGLPCSTKGLPSEQQIRAMVKELAGEGRVIIRHKKIFSRELLEAEETIAEAVKS